MSTGENMIFMNRCKQVRADASGNWEILACPGSKGVVYYVVRAWEEKMEHIVDAFIKAKQEGLVDKQTTIYIMECGEWVGAVGIYGTTLNIAVNDYSRKECVGRFMEIVDAVVRKLSEVRQ
jgi:hypothetical protein